MHMHIMWSAYMMMRGSKHWETPLRMIEESLELMGDELKSILGRDFCHTDCQTEDVTGGAKNGDAKSSDVGSHPSAVHPQMQSWPRHTDSHPTTPWTTERGATDTPPTRVRKVTKVMKVTNMTKVTLH